jgi:hypothetical protein
VLNLKQHQKVTIECRHCDVEMNSCGNKQLANETLYQPQLFAPNHMHIQIIVKRKLVRKNGKKNGKEKHNSTE